MNEQYADLAVDSSVKPGDRLAVQVEKSRKVRPGHLAGYNAPKEIHFVDELPRDVMGRIRNNVQHGRFGPATAIN